MNLGEESEYYLKAFLLREKDLCKATTVFRKIWKLSDDKNLDSLKWKTTAENALQNFKVEELIKILKLSKSNARSKADISINDVSYSVKEVKASPPAIVNHTPRPGFENVCNRIGVPITQLDEMVTEYWTRRIQGVITEDVSNSNPNSPFRHAKNYLKPIINYFVFTGSGAGDSRYPAEKVLELDYKSLPSGIHVLEKDEYFDEVWPNLIFSIRSKGMPSAFSKRNEAASIKKWTRFRDNSHKGSLHIRSG